MSTNMNTKLKNYNFVSFSWEIDNFSTREESFLQSEKISFPNKSDEDRNIPPSHLLMRPRERKYTEKGDKSYEVAIHLVPELNKFVSELNVTMWRIAILNCRGEKCSLQEMLVLLSSKGSCNTYKYTNDRTQLLDPQNGLLVNDKLTIYCEVEIIDKDYIKCYDSLAQDYESLLESSKFSDVVLVVGGHELKAHANILSTRSKVFAAMFEHDCEEKRNNRVEITDVDKEVFQELLRFIYTGKVGSLDLYAAELIVAADKYELDPLKCICERYLSNHLTAESVCQILLMTDSHQFGQLKEKCIEYITRNSKDIKLADWKAICESNLELAHRLFQQRD